MSKKPIFLFAATFIIAVVLAFFSSHLIVQQVRGVTFGSSIDMSGKKIFGVSVPRNGSDVERFDAMNLGYFESLALISLPAGGTKGNTCEIPYSVDSWCDLNDFDFCGGQNDFPPYDEPAPSCFTAETQILMADGSYKPIKDVKVGDWVLTKESENSDKMVSTKVARTFEHTADSYLIINNELKVTDTHPIFVNNKWKQARTIKLGDKLLNEKGREVIVESLELEKGPIEVYNLKIEGYHTYFAGGIYVHNKPEVAQ